MASSQSISSPAAEDLTPAQRLMQQHAAAQSHQPSVEDVVDEEDIAHPPPSSLNPSSDAPAVVSDVSSNDQPMSAKAVGKQKATNTTMSNKGPMIDTQSEEAFPSLGAPKATPPAASAWGRKPAAVSKPSNGTSTRSNGNMPSANGMSSGTSTPASGFQTPNLQPSSHNLKAPAHGLNIPNRYTEGMAMPNDQIKKELPKALKDLVRDISKKHNAKINYTTADGSYIFQGSGSSQQAVQQALREVSATIGAQTKISVPIPASVRSHIIGKAGATIQGISKRTGARMNLDKDQTQGFDPSDEDALVDVHIEGNPMSVRMAQQEVENIVAQRGATLNTRIKHIPPELFPFLAGPHNSSIRALENESEKDIRIKVPEYQTWARQPPKEAPAGSQGLQLAGPQDGYHIQIQGDRQAARQIQAQLEAQARELERLLTVGQVQIEKERHGFILGDRGISQHDFLEETGCAVVLPPSHDDAEIVLILGPPQQIETGINKAMDLAAAMSVTNVDIARQHQNARQGAQAHARDLTRYLRQRQALEQFEKLYDSHVVFPPSMDKPTAWQIYSRDAKNAMKARSDILNLVSAHPPSRFRNVDLHQFYHRHLTPSQAQTIREQHGVHLVVPEEDEDLPQVLLVYEGSSAPEQYQFPRRQPSPAEIAQFGSALEEAENFIMQLIGEQQQIVQRSVDAPSKYREKLQRYLNREQRDQGGLFPVQLLGLDAPIALPHPSFPVEFRGPSSAVDDFAQTLRTFIEEQIRDEAERDYTISFDFPQKFANFLIGKKGENINKLRDEFDVDIQVGDGKVEIKGPKAKADAAKAHILSMGRKLEDETTHALKIDPKFHRELIGKSGAQIKRLEDRYNVRINFPRNNVADDASVVDEAASEVGAGKRRGPSSAIDEVFIKGPRKNADEARDELFSLYNYYQENSHTATVSVAQSQLPFLIGQGGRELENLRLSTKAEIEIPGSKDASSLNGRVEVKIKGTKSAVEEAKKLIQEKAKVFDDTVTRTVNVNKSHHRALIGREGENIRQIIVAAGAVGESRELSRMVQFPKADSTDDSIRVEGPQQTVERIVAAIESFVKNRESQVTEAIEIPPERHGALIGRRGETKKKIESDNNVVIFIPNTDVTGSARSLIKITGLPDNVRKAKDQALSMIKTQEGDKILIPIRFHHAIADTSNGAFFRNLNRDLQVTVNHAGHAKPPRPEPVAISIRSSANGAAMPLITDDSSSEAPTLDYDSGHGWDVIQPQTAPESGEDPTIPWILAGASTANIAQARAQIEAALADAQNSVTGHLLLPDPKWHRFVIGPSGSTVNAIRADTGCKIDVPKAGGAGEAILIRGPMQNVEDARRKIIKAVNDGLSNTSGGGRTRR